MSDASCSTEVLGVAYLVELAHPGRLLPVAVRQQQDYLFQHAWEDPFGEKHETNASEALH